ncbi:hypothetical protein RF11_03718 [Thelohanellus kitauei]|uniref:Tc1-like transposase DDE domain-containing protein n=1 Tax=Thelohanellus kitauei TaxID=669202 RepID=A0A0C2JJS6_THEKT|nr:hypothetical protein RF11_03718 [Thelohanellus kitauei]
MIDIEILEDGAEIATIDVSESDKSSHISHNQYTKFKRFNAQYHPFTEEHFCGCHMEAFELFFSSGINECIFIKDNVKFHKTNRVQTMLQENGHRIKNRPI